jgi:hypothetical protein
MELFLPRRNLTKKIKFDIIVKEEKMKIRNGFVSNSSSSSFIAAFGRIKRDKIKKAEENGLRLLTLEELLKYDMYSFRYKEETETLKVFFEDLYDMYVDDIINVDKEKDRFVFYGFVGGEDDNYFYNEEYGELDYDIVDSIDYFDKIDTDVKENISKIQKNKDLFESLSVNYGAKRIG